MKIIDLKNETGFIKQYIDLRNQYAEQLLSLPVNISETKQWLKKPDIIIKGLVEKNILKGVVILYLDKGGEVAFFVKERGKGIGGRLLKIIEDAAEEKKINGLWAWVLEDNIAAQKAFKKNGYIVENTSERKYNNKIEQGIIFKKVIKVENIIHTREVYGIEKGAEEFPKMVVVSTTYICNAKCPHCPYTEANSDLRRMYRDALFISSELFKKIADECGKFGSFIRITGGGEPLLHKDMVDLIEYSKKAGASVWLNTNGSLFAQKIADRLLRCKIDLVEFSADAADKDTYDKVRTGLDFDNLVKNVTYTVNERNRLKLSTRIAVSVVNQDTVKDKIEEIKKFWLLLGVDEVIVRKFLTWGSTTTLDSSSSADTAPYLIKEKGDPCPYPFHRLNIDTRGKVEICGFDIAGRTNLGNINEQTIQEIWKGPQFSWWRKMHIERRGGEIPLCSECPDWRYRSWNYNWERVLDTTLARREEVFKKKES